MTKPLSRLIKPSLRFHQGAGGFSMTELVIVISVIGVLSTLTVTSFSHLLAGSKDAVASERVEMLNRALHTFCQQNYEMNFTRADSNSNDEIAILRTLQYRNPDTKRVKIGSPYMDPRYRPVDSSSTTDHRIRWTGRCYELLKPGTTGNGIKMNFDGTDFTTAFVFPPNFQMAGR